MDLRIGLGDTQRVSRAGLGALLASNRLASLAGAKSFTVRDTLVRKSLQPTVVLCGNRTIGNLKLELRMIKLFAIDGSMKGTVWLPLLRSLPRGGRPK